MRWSSVASQFIDVENEANQHLRLTQLLIKREKKREEEDEIVS